MSETKKLLSDTEGSKQPAHGSGSFPGETKDLSKTELLQPPPESSGGCAIGNPTKIGRYTDPRTAWVRAGLERVYLAHDDDLDRPVAIKVPSPERIAYSEDVEAFLVEARILAKLDHPEHRAGL